MTDEEIRKRYQRDGGPLGKNKLAIDKFIRMLHTHEKSSSKKIRDIVANLQNLQNLEPDFIIFESEKVTGFMHQFAALRIDIENSDDLVLSHEFGHGVLSMINGLELPDGYEETVKQARANCISQENKEKFRQFVEYISDKDNTERTEAEKGPVSDIISSIFQYPGLSFAATNKTCILPSYHDREYYFDEEKGIMKTDAIFDENFANFYALVANNCAKELQTLRELLGDDWMKEMEQQLEKAAKTIEMAKEKEPEKTAIEQIKSTIMDVRESQIQTEERSLENDKSNQVERG